MFGAVVIFMLSSHIDTNISEIPKHSDQKPRLCVTFQLEGGLLFGQFANDQAP